MPIRDLSTIVDTVVERTRMFKPELLTHDVIVIGAGLVGSWVALIAGQQGVKDVAGLSKISPLQ